MALRKELWLVEFMINAVFILNEANSGDFTNHEPSKRDDFQVHEALQTRIIERWTICPHYTCQSFMPLRRYARYLSSLRRTGLCIPVQLHRSLPRHVSLWTAEPFLHLNEGVSYLTEQLGMWKRSILVPFPPLPLPLPFCSTNTSSYPILQNGSGQSLPHP